MDMTTRSLSAERNEKARAFLRAIIDGQFGGNVSAAARALGVTYSALHEVLNGRRGVGMRMLDAMKAFTGTSIVEILGESESEAAPEGRPSRTSDLVGWQVAERSARAFARETPEWVWLAARQCFISNVHGAVTPQFVLDLARLVQTHGQDPGE